LSILYFAKDRRSLRNRRAADRQCTVLIVTPLAVCWWRKHDEVCRTSLTQLKRQRVGILRLHLRHQLQEIVSGYRAYALPAQRRRVN
jgi:hypothetical protein